MSLIVYFAAPGEGLALAPGDGEPGGENPIRAYAAWAASSGCNSKLEAIVEARELGLIS